MCGLLRATGVAGRPESYFRAPDAQKWADRWCLRRDDEGADAFREYLQGAVADGTSANGVFAARIMWGTLGEVVAQLGVGRSLLFDGGQVDTLVRTIDEHNAAWRDWFTRGVSSRTRSGTRS